MQSGITNLGNTNVLKSGAVKSIQRGKGNASKRINRTNEGANDDVYATIDFPISSVNPEKTYINCSYEKLEDTSGTITGVKVTNDSLQVEYTFKFIYAQYVDIGVSLDWQLVEFT